MNSIPLIRRRFDLRPHAVTTGFRQPPPEIQALFWFALGFLTACLLPVLWRLAAQ